MMQQDFKNKVARMWGQTRVDARELGWALSGVFASGTLKPQGGRSIMIRVYLIRLN